MPQFTTISPTHVPGKKEYAWQKFLSGGYVAIGWLGDKDLTGKKIEEVEELIRKEKYENEASAIQSYRKFLSLKVGDYVAVNNVGYGLFGVGQITSPYKFQLHKHDSGSEDVTEYYSHYREIKWLVKEYLPRTSLVAGGETAWAPYGTVGGLYPELPPYIVRIVHPQAALQTEEIKYVRPDFLASVIKDIESLRPDVRHQERAHESLVEDFFVALGYQKHKDIKFRQGRIDITLEYAGLPIAVIEVKRDWALNMNVVRQQAYAYAHSIGVRYVLLTNGETYILYDRLKGLSWDSNLLGEFRLTALQDEDLKLIDRLRPKVFGNPDLHELFRHLSEMFAQQRSELA